MLLPFFELNLNYTVPKRYFSRWSCAFFFGNGIYEGQIQNYCFMLLFAFSHNWTKSSKVASVLVLRKSFPLFLLFIASPAMNVSPFSRYLMLVVSGPHVFTKCARPVNKWQFLFWLLQLSAHSQTWSSLHWRINAGTLTQYQMLYDQQLRHERECNSLVYQESLTQMFHWK